MFFVAYSRAYIRIESAQFLGQLEIPPHFSLGNRAEISKYSKNRADLQSVT